MNNKKTMILGVSVIIIFLFMIWGCVRAKSDKASFLKHTKTVENQDKEEKYKIKKPAEYDMFGGINQCIWGTWVITEVWYGYSCHEEDELRNTVIKILPQRFSFGEKTSTELEGYWENLIAIEDNEKDYYEIETFQNLGMEGDYYLMFSPKWDNYKKDIFPFRHFVLLSETEMMIPVGGHDRYMLQKIESFDEADSDIPLMAGELTYRSTCYGKWLITEKLTKDKMLKNDLCIGQTVIIRSELVGFASCRVFGRSEEKIEEFAVQIGVSNENKYLVCYDFPEDYFWDQMICVDDMTAVLVKGNELFRAKRISAPEEDDIYDEIG